MYVYFFVVVYIWYMNVKIGNVISVIINILFDDGHSDVRNMCPVSRMLQHPANWTHNPQLHTRPAT